MEFLHKAKWVIIYKIEIYSAAMHLLVHSTKVEDDDFSINFASSKKVPNCKWIGPGLVYSQAIVKQNNLHFTIFG